MKNFFKEFNNNDQDITSEDKRKRRIILYIIIIIIILLLITSCSCTSKFFGKIGDMFRGESNYTIDNTTDNQEVVKNKELQFDTDHTEMALSDTSTKISFSYKNINPGGFTCSTSDAEIATCYVANNYVVVIPKKSGDITVYLQTTTNGKTYEATTKVSIKDINRAIELESNSGTMNLKKMQELNVVYRLVGLVGDVSVSSSDERVATASAKDGILSIKGLNVGTATITLSITYNERVYTNTYTIKVINGSSSDSSTKPGSSTNTQVPEKPNENPGTGEEKPPIVLDSDSTLRSLTTNKGTIDFDPNTHSYYIGLGAWNWRITLKAQPTSTKAKLSYTYNGVTVSSLEKLKLNTGDNKVVITVTAEDGSTSIYEVIVNKAKSSKNYLKSLTTSEGTLEPKFNKNTLSYTIKVDYDKESLDLVAKPRSKKSTITYTYNGKVVSDLNQLSLNTGDNYVQIIVTAENGVSRTYQVIINRAIAPGVKDSNSLLKDLTISKGSLVFDPYVNRYVVGVGTNVTEVSLEAILSSSKATVTYTYNNTTVDDLNRLHLRVGDNTVVITVTAEDGSQTNYTVIINRATPSSDSSLKELTTNKGILIPGFDKDILSYDIHVASKEDTITLTASLANAKSTMSYTLNGKTIDTLENLPLNAGKNVVEILVTSEDGTSRVYTVTIYREVDPDKGKDSTLSKIEVLHGVGSLVPEFAKDIKEYVVEVGADVQTISFEAQLNDQKALGMRFTYNGKEVTSILDLPLVTGDKNVLVITGIAEDGVTETDYKIVINKAADPDKSNNNLLSKLEISHVNKGTLDPVFSPKVEHYKVNVSASDNTITLKGTAANNKATITYTYKNQDGVEITTDSGENISLKPGNNEILVTVTAEDGTPKVYTVVVYKPVYTVLVNVLDKYYVEEAPFHVSYIVQDETGAATTDYKVEDISVDLSQFNDLFTIDTSVKGIVTLVPKTDRINELVDQSMDLTVIYNHDKKDTKTMHFANYSNYYLRTENNVYNVTLNKDKNSFWDIVLNTNLFVGSVKSTPIENGVHLYTEENENVSIDVVDVTEGGKYIQLVPGDLSSSSSITVRANLNSVGTAKVHVKGNYYGKTIEFDVFIAITEKYSVTISAGAGFFQPLVTEYKYEYESGTKIELSHYVPYKVDEAENCKYFALDYYLDAEGNKYQPTDVVEVKKELVLTAVYKLTSEIVEIKDTGKYYLENLDLFNNEKFLNNEKVIHPGVSGEHRITLTNNVASKIIITGMTLEEDTICIQDGNVKGCINMEYALKRTDLSTTDVYYYPGAGKNGYTILNQDANRNTTDNYRDLDKQYTLRTLKFAEEGKENIELAKGDTIEFFLLWKWSFEGVDDILDTKIGEYVSKQFEEKNINEMYHLLIGFDYEIENAYCKKEAGTN